MTNKIIKKVKSNLTIYKKDLREKGLYWSIIDRLYKVQPIKKILRPITNKLKSDYVLINNDRIYIDKEDRGVSEGLIHYGKWEEYTTKIFLKYVKKGDVVLDLGANIGYFTFLAAKKVGTTGKVYAFEPDPNNFRLLEKSAQNNSYKNIVLVNKAVSDKDGEAKLYFSNDNPGDHRIFDANENRNSVGIEMVTLDTYCKKIKKVDVIKMDIQGAEIKAFAGGKDVINRNKNIKIITEFWPYGLKLIGSSGEKFLNVLKNFGFTFSNVSDIRCDIKPTTIKQLVTEYPIGEEIYTNVLCEKK